MSPAPQASAPPDPATQQYRAEHVHDDRGPRLISTLIVLKAFAIDDWLLLASLLTFAVVAAFEIWGAERGMMKHVWAQDAQTKVDGWKASDHLQRS